MTPLKNHFRVKTTSRDPSQEKFLAWNFASVITKTKNSNFGSNISYGSKWVLFTSSWSLIHYSTLPGWLTLSSYEKISTIRVIVNDSSINHSDRVLYNDWPFEVKMTSYDHNIRGPLNRETAEIFYNAINKQKRRCRLSIKFCIFWSTPYLLMKNQNKILN